MPSIHELGKKGESLAADHLVKQGYKILATNYVWSHREVDILAQKGDVLIVVEVKTRSSSAFGEPETFVSKAKQKLLIETANHFAIKNQITTEIRFDIISITFKGVNHQLHHIEDAFYPTI